MRPRVPTILASFAPLHSSSRVITYKNRRYRYLLVRIIVGEWSIVMNVCVCVCVSSCVYLSTSPELQSDLYQIVCALLLLIININY